MSETFKKKIIRFLEEKFKNNDFNSLLIESIETIDSTLKYQSTIFNGTIFKKPFPIVTFGNSKSIHFGLSSFFLKFPLGPSTLLVPSFDKFLQDCKTSSSQNIYQEGKLVAFYQVSRMGKTKFCFTWGLTHAAIIIRNFVPVTKELGNILDFVTIIYKDCNKTANCR